MVKLACIGVASWFLLLASAAQAAGTGERFVRKLALPNMQTAVIAEGDWEARSIGSYSVRIYSAERAQPGDDTTFFTSGIVRARDGVVEKIVLADLQGDGRQSLVVVIRSVGSGGYLSADAFSIEKPVLALRASVSGLAPSVDVVDALRAAVRRSSAN
jgi:hypothetical protein